MYTTHEPSFCLKLNLLLFYKKKERKMEKVTKKIIEALDIFSMEIHLRKFKWRGKRERVLPEGSADQLIASKNPTLKIIS